MDTKINSVASYIAHAPKEVRKALKELRSTIKKAAPKAKERMSYGMPFYEYGGTGYKGRLIYFAAFKKHISLFITPWDSNNVPLELKKYNVSKATYRFPLGKALPLALIAKTVGKIVAERKKAKNS